MSGDGERSDHELARTATAPGASAPAAPAEQLGNVLGRYRLERELGAGGMGVVHAAFDPDLERRVALKVLRHAGSAEARQRLLREARALARVTHPNVVIVHEVGSANGRDYVAMELIEGETLADWLKAAPRRPREIVAAFIAAGKGLAAAHAAGLVHRDFKPHNVLRRTDGRIVVTDFGLARGIEVAIDLETTMRVPEGAATASATPSSLSGLTQTGSVLGTPAYMAPEQWSGGAVGPAADQFAFCVALWEALAGERPFRGATIEELKKAVRRGPSAADDSKVPRRLRTVLKRGLDPDPERRWPNMDALIAALGRAERPRGLWLGLAGAALAATGAVYLVAGTGESGPSTAAPACERPVLDPATVWTPAIANELRDKTSPAVMRRFDALFAGWQAARDVACGLDTPMRARRLACLDGVIARLDVVRKASVYRNVPMLDHVSRLLVDPGVCNVEDPPRLPAKLSDAAVPAFALSIPPAGEPELDPDAAAQADAAARHDPCARAYAQLARVYFDEGRTAEVVDEALQLADSCGDDRARADALLASVVTRINLFLDPKLQRTLAAADVAVRKVAQPDLVAHLDLVKATIAGFSGRYDEQIELAESAIRGFGETRPLARLEGVETKVQALLGRQQRGDLEAARAELARWRPEAERLDRPRMVATFDAFDIMAQWKLGDVEGAAARYGDLYERWEQHRKRTLTGVSISGTVVDAKGSPVAGATVVAGRVIIADSVSIEFWVTHDGLRRATTDSDGTYRLDHVEPDSIILAQHGELRSRVREAKDQDRLVLEPTTHISGRVIDPEPQRLNLFVLPGDRQSPMYQLTAPIAADGTFTLERVPIGSLRIGAAHSGSLGTQSFAMHPITVGPQGKTGVEIRRARGRKLRVIVRSSANVPLTGAQVFVISGNVAIRSVKEIETALRSAGMALEVARPPAGEMPDVSSLVPGDLVATFTSAPTGNATACALGLTGDFADQRFRANLEKYLERLELRCVSVPADAKVVTVEVPPLKRID